jgi:mono/diheme cytochrome c family protein
MAGAVILHAFILQGRSDEKKSDPVEYNKDIRPIFQETCFQCHGTDAAKAKGELQLDSLAHATKKNSEGRQAIVPGDPDQSLLIERIFSSDKEEIMPPLKIHKNLTDAQKSKLKSWISQGAHYQEHWAYLAPRHSPIPEHVQPEFWANNIIDAWIAKQLNENGLRPNDEADRYSLIRRASLDLLGLLPSPEEIHSFVKDPDPQAYEKLIDRLLASPRYGEEMARQWLDLARYGDTHGIHIDNHRSIWPYRDWVIKAFNANQPYDQFSIEQLAGDLLPNPTQDQLVATGYLRCNPTTSEGGAIAEEYQAIYDRDRVIAFSSAWLGVTMGCASCHDHKFDPVTQRDFYQLSAYFRNIDTPAMDGNLENTPPSLRLTDDRDALNRLEAELAQSQKEVDALRKQGGKELEVTALEKRLQDLRQRLRSYPETLIARERKQRAFAHVLDRGQYNQKKDMVFPSVPAAFGVPLPKDAREDRLALARWLFDPRHPMTARLQVNRLWQKMFGQGLVATAADFGNTGEAPSHPELLDALALQFRDSGWDVKAMLRAMALSRSYRQSAAASSQALRLDPRNRLLSRGPRHRLDAEVLRDVALQSSGLLVEKLGGPSVKPYQPAGLWEPASLPVSNTRVYVQDHGEKLYRRSLYTYIKRGCPPPTMITFNATSRESPCACRERTNTPLQALVSLNDPQFVEAARKLAERCLAMPGSREERLGAAYLIVTSRKIDDGRLDVLKSALADFSRHFEKDKSQAAALLAVGEAPRDSRFEAAELAAWTAIASMILNLDESLSN